MKPNSLLKKPPKIKPDSLNILYRKFAKHFQLSAVVKKQLNLNVKTSVIVILIFLTNRNKNLTPLRT